MLARGEAIRPVLVHAFGACSAGRAWQACMLDLLDALPTVRLRRQVLSHFLRLFGYARRHGSQWRVVDQAGYVGRQHEARPRVSETFDPLTGEVLHEVHEKGAHVAGESAGGLARLEHRCPRTLIRYRGYLRDAQENPIERRGRGRRRPSGGRAVMASSQPKPTDSGAVAPRTEGACWAYAQHWLTLPPSPAMLEHWGARPNGGTSRPAPRIGSAELPRLPTDPQALAELLHELRER